MSVVFNLGGGNWAGRYSKMLAYKVDNGNYIANELGFVRTTTGTFVNQNGLIEEQELRVPRVDYLNNSNGTLLVEPQRTNYITYSEDFSQWNTIGSPTLTSNYGQSPDGKNNSTRVEFSSGDRIYIGVNISGNISYSVYLKGTGSVRMRDTSGAYVNDVTLTNEWVRYDYTFNASITNVQLQQTSGTSDFEIWGVQVESGSFLTSYIPTSGTSVTRAVDYFNGYFDEVTTQGTIFIDFEQLTQSGLAYRFRDPFNQTSYGFYFYSGGMDVYNGAAFIVDRSTLEPNNSKVALSWNGTSVKVFINGNDRTKSGAVASIRTTSQIIFNDSNDIANLNEVKVYATQLTDEELINLTT